MLQQGRRGPNVSTARCRGTCEMTTDWAGLVADLERLLKLRSIPFGMKLFERREEMEAIPRIRRPSAVHTLDQIVAQAARLGWTVGLTSEDLGRRAMPRRRRARRRQGRGLAFRQAHGRRLVFDARGRRRSPGGDGMRARRKLRGAGGGAACRRPARPARHRALLCYTGGDDLFHQRPAMVGLQALRLECRRRVRPAPIPGAAP